MKWSRQGRKGRGSEAGIKVKGEGSRSRPVKWAGQKTAEIGLPGGVLSTYTSRPDPWDAWDN